MPESMTPEQQDQLVATNGLEVVKAGSTMEEFIESYEPKIAKALAGQGIDSERFIRRAVTDIKMNNNLMRCERNSLIGAVIRAAQYAFNPGTGEYYVIPRGGKASFEIGYKGWVTLAYRSGKVKAIEVRPVYQDDEFDHEFGLDSRIKHVPSPKAGAADGLPTYVYAIIHTTMGGVLSEVWSWERIMDHKKRYSKGGTGWKDAPVAMAKKTVFLQAMTYGPWSADMQTAAAADNAVHTIHADTGAVVEAEEVTGNPRLDDIKTAIKAAGLTPAKGMKLAVSWAQVETLDDLDDTGSQALIDALNAGELTT